MSSERHDDVVVEGEVIDVNSDEGQSLSSDEGRQSPIQAGPMPGSQGFTRSPTRSPPRTSHVDVSGRPPAPAYDQVLAQGFGMRQTPSDVDESSDDESIMDAAEEVPPRYYRGDEEDIYTEAADLADEGGPPRTPPMLVSDDEEEVEADLRHPVGAQRRGRQCPRLSPFHRRNKKKKKTRRKSPGRPAKKRVSQETIDLENYLANFNIDLSWLPPELKKDLLVGRVTLKAMNRFAKVDSQSKHIINKIANAEEIYQAGCTTAVKTACGLNPRKRLCEEEMNQPLHKIPKKTRTIPRWDYLKEQVYKFYMDDQYSRCSPGKGDYVKVKGEKLQKRICNDYVRNLHTAFLALHPTLTVSLSTFYRLRPGQVLTSKYLTKDTTCCQKHQNFQLMLKALSKVVPYVKCITSPDAFIEEYDTQEKIQQLLDTFDEEAHQGMIVYEQWGRVNDSTDGKVKTRIVKMEDEPAEFMEKFMQKYLLFVDHNHRANHQYAEQRRCKQQLKPGECLVQVDFIQNYACLVQDAAQSSFFDQTQVTVHASVVYYREEEEGDLKHKSFVHASPVNTHNAAMVCAILDKLWTEDFREEKERLGIHTVHYYSDSPFSQYRNKWMFNFVATHQRKYGIKATWDYFETGHGKGPCDGVGGSIKRLADDAQKFGKRIQDAEDFVKWAAESDSVSYLVSYISQERFDQFKADYEYLKTILMTLNGSARLHAVRPSGTDGIVEWRDTSCKCTPEDECPCVWKVATIRDATVEEGAMEPNNPTNIQPGDHVILEYHANIYLAMAMEEKEGGYYEFELYQTMGRHLSLKFKKYRDGRRLRFPTADIYHKCAPLEDDRRSAEIKKLKQDDRIVFTGLLDDLM